MNDENGENFTCMKNALSTNTHNAPMNNTLFLAFVSQLASAKSEFEYS